MGIKIGMLVIFFMAILIVTGWVANNVYSNITNNRKIDGLRFELYGQNNSWKGALEKAESLETNGDWVCVNVKGMDFDRAIAVCRHEVGHEIFAEFCEQSDENFNKCKGITDDEK